MAANFNVQFIINEKTQSRVIRLTDTSTGFTLAKGNFSVTFPDGSTRIKTDFASPDITSAGGYIDVLAVLDSQNKVITGSYKIDFVGLDASNNQYTSTKIFDFNWITPSNGLTNLSDSIIPEVKFSDATSYGVNGSFTGAVTKTISTTLPSNTAVSGTVVSTTSSLLDVKVSNNYYEGIYTVTNDLSASYTHTSYSWLTISYVTLYSKQFDIRQTPNQLQLITKINTYKDFIDSLKNSNQSRYQILSEEYDLVVSLYTHLITRYQAGLLDGSQSILTDLLGYLEPYVPHTYQSTPLTAFSLASNVGASFTITDGTNNSNIALGDTLLFSSPLAGLGLVVSNDTLTLTGKGTSSQFLKADGSIDSSIYLTGITSGQVISALGYTPYNATNPNGYTSNLGTVTSVAALTLGTTGTDLSSSVATGTTTPVITLNVPTASATNRGALSSSDWTTFNNKQAAITLTTTGTSGAATFVGNVLNIPQYQGGVTSFNTRTGAITLSSSDVTSALGYTPENSSNKGVANGYASLDGSGLVPSTQLPSYVDDVLEYTNLASFPATGETGKIYVDLATNKIYRWSGSAYIEVSPTVGTIWGGITGTLSNQTDLQNALNAKQATITLTTTGSSGSATFSSNTLNIPTYTLAGLGGQASSTNLTSLSGLTYVSASFVKMTAAGTFSLDTNTYYLASNPSGYTNNTGTVTSVSALTIGTTGTDITSSVATSTTTPVITLNIPTASASNRGALSSADWTTFNNKQSTITLTTTGSSGAATFSSNTLNIPTYTLAGLGGQASSTNLTSLSGLTFASTSFVKMTAAGTFALDTNTYYLASNPSGYTNNTGTVTSVGGTGTAFGLTLTGTVTTSGNLTLGGTLAVPVANITATGTPSSTTYLRGDGTWSTISSSGTVTSVSVVSANGFAGTVATATSTPAITISTTVTGLLKGNGTAISAAVANTDYLAVNNPVYTGSLGSGTLTYTPANLFLYAQQSQNSYIQAVFQNSSTNPQASADIIVNNNLSTDTTYYGNFGINGSGFTGSGSFNLANATYLTATSGDLVLGTTTSNAIRFVINSSATDSAVIKTTGQLQLLGYTATTSFTGTAAGYLAFDSSGNILTVAAPTGGSGTVTSVSIVSANGISGTVATATTTPAITLSLGAITPTTVNGLTLTSAATGFTIAGGTTSKTLTVSNTLTLAGTDTSTLNIGSGGTLGSAAFTASTAYQASNTNLTSLSGLTFASTSFVKMTAAGTFALDTNTYYLASNPSGYTNNTGTVTSVSITTANGISGTVATSTTTPAITLSLGAITPTTVNGLTLTSAATGFTIAGGTTSKTLTVSNTLTLAGTDTSTLNIGSGGTLGSAAFTASTAYQASNTNLTSLAGLTFASTSFVKMTAAGTFALDTNTYATSASIGNGTLTLAVSGTGLSGSATFTANQSTGTTFTVTSNATSANTASAIVARDASGNFSAGAITCVSLTETSSIRYKENILQLDSSLEKICKLRGVTYNRKDTGKKEIGVIAEEVYEVIPEIIFKNKKGEIDSVGYGRITALLIEAVKEQQAQIVELKNQINQCNSNK